MRDNPPTSPFPQHQRRQADTTEEDTTSLSHFPNPEMPAVLNNNVLSADDLGMLMLHIHECRTILWRDYNRFSPGVIQNVTEDLAELAGERGASVPVLLAVVFGVLLVFACNLHHSDVTLLAPHFVGAVSVQQQLQIISRMCRTYPFLKVISIGTTFHENFMGGSRL
jgi:hypothetical protein